MVELPGACHHGHCWEPGLVTAGWQPCDCPEAKADTLGHLYVGCCAEDFLSKTVEATGVRRSNRVPCPSGCREL